MEDDIDIECVFKAALQYAIEWYEDVIIMLVIRM